MSIELATVSTKGQMVIPQDIRERHHIAPGDIIEVHDTPEGFLVKKHPMPVRMVSQDKTQRYTRKRDPVTGIMVIHLPKDFKDPGDVNWEKTCS